MKTITKIYLHGDKEDNHENGKKLGLQGKALEEFLYACYEVELELEVDTETGGYTIISVDGMALVQK